MLFNSYIFVLLFLPTFIVGYYFFNKFKLYTVRKFFVLVMSLLFYGYGESKYLFIIISSILINYLVYGLIIKKEKQRKLLLVIGISANLILLFVFKYLNFAILNINMLFHSEYSFFSIALPLGISFYTFQQISFLVEVYRGRIKDVNFLDYACFVSFFPQLIAGPIVSYEELVPQFNDCSKSKLNWDNISKGIYIFFIGMFKKVIIADTFGRAVAYGYDNISLLDSTSAIIIILSYTFQIYFDFSAYGDMAIGIAKMFNYDLPINFNSPYKASNISEFWKRWHITLTRFLTQYVYIPLGGNRKGYIRKQINILIVFFLSGIWHGAGYTFILWGFMHGAMMVIHNIFEKANVKINRFVSWIYTFIFVNVAWVFFRAETCKDAIRLLEKVIACRFTRPCDDILKAFELTEFNIVIKRIVPANISTYASIVIFFIAAFVFSCISDNAYEKMKKMKCNIMSLITIIILAVWTIISFEGISTFLYFRF